jgi:uncharacterized protein YjbJ (UPF0337 family)
LFSCHRACHFFLFLLCVGDGSGSENQKQNRRTLPISKSSWLAVAPIRFGYAHAPVKALDREKGEQMNDSTKDELQGKAHELKGGVKEAAGKVTNQPDLEADGQNEKLAGTIQKKIGQVEKVLGS